MLCISRYTDDTYAQQFADGRHKFYLEFRCNRPCTNDIYCSKCTIKNPSAKVQHLRTFNHGDVGGPIPDSSHIFGGKWYNDGVKKWGAPSFEIIEFAVKYRNEACEGLSITNILLEPEVIIASLPPKKGRKPKVAETATATVVTENTPTIPRKARKKPVVSPYSTLVNTTTHLFHKEVSLPTHIETKLEEIDSSGYKIQYVKLGVFDANGTSYFRDAIKNKLYKKVKDKIGGYVGRWNPDTDSIIVDIPDSDDESL
jgi:hypothetical protein